MGSKDFNQSVYMLQPECISPTPVSSRPHTHVMGEASPTDGGLEVSSPHTASQIVGKSILYNASYYMKSFHYVIK